LNFLESFPRNWCDISFEDGENSTLATNALMPCEQVLILAKGTSPVESSTISSATSFGSNLVSTGVQTDRDLNDEPSCKCQRKVMVNRDVQTEDIEVRGSAQCAYTEVSISSREQQGSPAVTNAQRLSKYFPTVADEIVERAVSNGGEDCFEPPDSESHCLGGSGGEGVVLALEFADRDSLVSSVDGKPISRWETSINLNNVTDGKFGAVAYESNGASNEASSNSVESEEKEFCSLRNRSDQSGMSLAIEMSKARILTGLQTLGSAELSRNRVICEDSSESFPSTGLNSNLATTEPCQSDYVNLLKVLADSGPLPNKQADECEKLALKCSPALAIGRQSPLLSTLSLSGVHAIQGFTKVNATVLPKVSRIPPPPPRRPPIGNSTAITLNNKGCNPGKLSCSQKSLDFTKCATKFAKEGRPPSVSITDNTKLPSSLTIDGTSSPVKQQRECSNSPVGTRKSCDITTPTSNRRKLLAVGTPLLSARNDACGVVAVGSHAAAESQNRKAVDRMSATGRASQITSGTRRQSRGTEQRSRPSVTPKCSRVKGGPRVSVGRKSLSKRRSIGVQEKHHSTKLTRSVVWLLNATKSTKRKVVAF